MKSDVLKDVNSDQQQGGLEADVNIDRATSMRLGLTISAIDNTLYDAFGQRQVSTIYNALNQYHVVMEVAPRYWQDPSWMRNVWASTSGANPTGTQSTNASVANYSAATAATSTAASIAADAARNLATNSLAASGHSSASTGSAVSTSVETMIPFSAFANLGQGHTPLGVNHQGQFPAATISFNLAPGKALSDAQKAIEDAVRDIGMPSTVRGAFAGTAATSQQAQSGQLVLIGAALLAVYLVLGILYESYIHPITIISTLPSASVGALIALKLFNTEFTIIAFIGIILLIGIVKKNAIMMIDFALQAEREGLDTRDAITQACLLRFRPIMMTTCAAMFGALPLAFGTGEGSELRHPLGITIVGGLLFSQALTLYTTPVIFLYLDRFGKWVGASVATRISSSGAGARRWNVISRLAGWGGFAAVAASAPLSGCAIGPDYLRPAAIVPAQYKEMKGWKISSPRDDFAKGEWWKLFGDRELDLLEAQVSISNQTLKQDEANYREALALIAEARAGLFPTVSFNPSLTRSQELGSITTMVEAQITGSWTPDIWGKVRRAIEEQGAAAQVSAADLANATLSAQSALALAYVQLRDNDSLYDLFVDTVRQYQRSLDITQNQYNAGTAAKSDVITAQALVLAAQASEINTNVARQQNEHAIAVLIGRPPSELSIPHSPLPQGIPAIPVSLPSTLLERRPDIAAAERMMQEENAAIGVAFGGYYPDLTLSGAFGYIGDPFIKQIAGANPAWSYDLLARADPVQRRPDRRAGRGGARHLRCERGELSTDRADGIPAGRGQPRGDPRVRSGSQGSDRSGQGRPTGGADRHQ